ncbi:MAG: MarR family winged helix-turn-helix transcriptional regulator [Acidimicrobiales bacterium]
MAQQDGPLPTIISVFRRAATLMIEDLVARLDSAGYPGLTPSHQVVFENLDRHGTRLTELATRAGMTHQSLGELVSGLEQRGYLERRSDPNDGRARIVSLTDTGRRMVRRALREMAAIEEEWRARLVAAGVTGDIVGAVANAVASVPPPIADRPRSRSSRP